jgi:hypothetical protein
MANKRDLKKDIQYLTEIVIIEAIELSEVVTNEEGRKIALNAIIDLAALHNNLISRVNHPDGKANRAMVKQHYRSIIDDLVSGCNNVYNQLNKISL